MLYLHYSLLQSKHPSSSPPLSLFTTSHTTLTSQLNENGRGYNNNAKKRRSSSPSSWLVLHAVDKDSQQFEVDPEKAKEALQKLDQQLQTLSKKQVSTPKIRASDVKLARDKRVENTPEISGSFLTYLTVALLIFTIFYNVLFYAVIKPSVDGPETPQPSSQSESRAAAVLQ